MVKQRVEVLIDPQTGKISVYVDGLPHEECMERARKLSEGNSFIPLKNEIKKKPTSMNGESSKSKEREKVER